MEPTVDQRDKSFRKSVLILYGLSLFITIPFALATLVAGTGGDVNSAARFALAAQAVPVTTIISMFLSKKNLTWFLLPILALIVMFV